MTDHPQVVLLFALEARPDDDASDRMPDDIVVEYDGEAIGWIESGVPDAGLSETFLEEWRRSIAARGGA